MSRQWTLGQRLAFGFLVCVLLLILVASVGLVTIYQVDQGQDTSIERSIAMHGIEQLRSQIYDQAATFRGWLLTRDERFMDRFNRSQRIITSLNPDAWALSREARDEFENIRGLHAEWVGALEQLQRRVATLERSEQLGRVELESLFETESEPRFDRLLAELGKFSQSQANLMDDSREQARRQVRTGRSWMIALAALATIAALATALLLARRIDREMNLAVAQIASSSTEMEVAARQQAALAQDQASNILAVTSTLQQLLATSRQIADSSRRVAEMSDHATTSAGQGKESVGEVRNGMNTIRSQVDTVVEHMLELGRQSQKAGGILDIINELVDQTNILAINATIEAVGAGEAGKRFLVVAEEIRRLSDRVTASSREIRELVYGMRAAANTTVMATEEGSKAVDDGTKRVAQLTESFERIVELVATTARAAQEIEFSTNQQTTAVEQVNAALEDVSKAAKEGEVTSEQASDMAAELAKLARTLARLVRHDPNEGPR